MWFARPTQLLTQGQWWSILMTQRPPQEHQGFLMMQKPQQEHQGFLMTQKRPTHSGSHRLLHHLVLQKRPDYLHRFLRQNQQPILPPHLRHLLLLLLLLLTPLLVLL